ncbi:hypothetical protein [Nocardia mangyaensis]|nr:hypothetical protein [Nocardia mangyaensis]MDO3647661.1 hypothetical protein [Nocardia mangyaensis]
MSYVMALAGFATVSAMAVSSYIAANAPRSLVKVRVHSDPRRR